VEVYQVKNIITEMGDQVGFMAQKTDQDWRNVSKNLESRYRTTIFGEL